MLSKQVQRTADEASQEGLRAIVRRVMTLSQVYDHLLGNGLSRTIDFGGYLTSLCSIFVSLEEARRRNIQMTCHCSPVILDLDGVTAMGLVISELISNSYAHAFPNNTWTISVWLAPGEAGDEATITFRDNGVGLTEQGGSKRHGLGLVKRFMLQVGGSAELRADKGSERTLRFPEASSPAVAPLR